MILSVCVVNSNESERYHSMYGEPSGWGSARSKNQIQIVVLKTSELELALTLKVDGLVRAARQHMVS